jgi:hypothetical protein
MLSHSFPIHYSLIIISLDMTPESRNISLLSNGSVDIFPRKRARATIEEQCFLWFAPRALLGSGVLNTHPAAVNQHSTAEEAVFSVDPPRGYIMRIWGIWEIELARVSELAVRAGNWVSGVCSWQNNYKEELGCTNKTLCVIWSDCETYESVARIRLVSPRIVKYED